MSNEYLISVEPAGTLDGLFRERVRRAPEAPAYRRWSRSREAWQALSWREMAVRVARWQQALAGEGFSPGDYYLPMMAGATVGYARSVTQRVEDLRQLRPTILIAVPRIFERVFGRIQDQLDKGGALKRAKVLEQYADRIATLYD